MSKNERNEKMKKAISFAIAVFVAVGLAPLAGIPSNAAQSGVFGYEIENGKATVIEVSASAGSEVTVPSVLGGYEVTKIGEKAFYGNKNIIKINLPETLTEIGINAFALCSNLKSVNIPSSLIRIKAYAFNGCSSLESVIFPETLEEIGSLAFNNCRKATFSAIPKNVTRIGVNPFVWCENAVVALEEGNERYVITSGCLVDTAKKLLVCGTDTSGIPADGSVTEIGDYAFAECKKMTEIIIPDTIEKIDAAAFFLCGKLKSITIPSSVKSLGLFVFSGCYELESATINEGLTELPQRTFGGCTSLKEVSLPRSLTSLSKNAFDKCSSLEKLTFHGNAFISDGFVPSEYLPEKSGLTVYYEPNFSAGFSTPDWGGYPCYPIGGATVVYGDADGDGKVDITNAMLVFYHVAKKAPLPDEALAVCDTNDDENVDIVDAMRIFYFVAKKIPSVKD